MTGAEIQALVDDIPCDLCNISPGLAPYAVLAALIDVSTGNPVPDTTQELLTEANCLTCLVPPGLVSALMIQAIRNHIRVDGCDPIRPAGRHCDAIASGQDERANTAISRPSVKQCVGQAGAARAG